MCGIAGWYRRGSRPVEQAIIARQCERLIHRGPDDAGNLIDGDFGFGMRRLSIIETYLHSVETVYNMERIRELYELIIEEVGKADPDARLAGSLALVVAAFGSGPLLRVFIATEGDIEIDRLAAL